MKRLAPQTYFSTALLAALMALPHAAQADDTFGDWSRGQQQWKKSQIQINYDKVTDGDKWDITIGAGVGVLPEYEGSDELEVTPLPMIEVVWDDWVFLGVDGLGASLYQTNNLNILGRVGYHFGRDEDDSNDLRGLGDVDGAATASLNIAYDLGPVSPYAEVTKHIGGTDGLQIQIGVQSMIPVGLLTGDLSVSDIDNIENLGQSGPVLLLGISADWADDNYTGDYFGVTTVQSARSGLAQYNAEAGFKSVNIDIGVIYPVTDSWTVNGQLGYSQLIGDAADSPIVKKEGQAFGAAFVSYKF